MVLCIIQIIQENVMSYHSQSIANFVYFRMSANYYTTSPIVRTRSVTPMTPEMSRLLPLIADRTVARQLGRSYEVSHAKTYFNPAR
jgi:hypothetical protein